MNIQLLTERFPEVKENYNLLVVKYWENFEGLREINHVRDCTSSESITRAFRSLVRNGTITIPAKIKRIRKKQKEEFIKYYHKEKV